MKSTKEQYLLFPPDPEQVIAREMQRFAIHYSGRSKLEKLLSGEENPNSLYCCHGGCDPCNQSILECFAAIQQGLAQTTERL
ncbi:MAG: hypothetical protein AAF518_00940 [Spirochaetota bacterium]